MKKKEIIVKGYTVLKLDETKLTVGFMIKSKQEIKKLEKLGIGNHYNGSYYVWLLKNGFHFIPSKKYEVTVDITVPKKIYPISNINNMVLDLNMSTDECLDKLEEIRIKSEDKNGKAMYRKISKTIIKQIKENCPALILAVLNGKKEEVKEKLINKKGIKSLINNYDKICDAIINCFLPSTLKNELKDYDLSIEECIKLIDKYDNLDKIKKELKKNPYKLLCEGLKKSFFSIDDKIISAFPNMVTSEQRYISSLDSSLKMLKQMTCNTIFTREEVVNFIEKKIKETKIPYYDFITLDGILEDIKNRGIIYKFKKDGIDWLTSEKNFEQERRIRKYFMQNNIEEWNIDIEKYTKLKDGKLTEEQKEVLKSVQKNKLTLVDAGGGTGKTASLKAVIEMLKDNHKAYYLLAPTGRVAKRMAELTGDNDTKTIDRLWYSLVVAQGSTLGYDDITIVVEEGSMLSVELFNKVLDLVEDCDNVRFIINLDLMQLPPIQAGCPVRDLIYSADKIDGVNVLSLTKVFRYNEGGIAKKCADARNGSSLYIDMKDNPMSKYSTCGKDFAIVETNDYRIAEQVKTEYACALKLLKSKGLTHYQAVEKITVIAPMKKGRHGTLVLNNILQEIANPKNEHKKEIKVQTDTDNKIYTNYRVNDRVMNTENNYQVLTKLGYEKLQLKEITMEEISEMKYNPNEEDCKQYAVPCYNGSFGTIIDVDEKNKIVFVKFDDVVLVFQKMQILKLSLAYAVTCHKLQGSENDFIISVFTKLAEHMTNRNMIYTTISRSKKYFIGIWTEWLIEEKIFEEEIVKRNTILNFLLESDFSLTKIIGEQRFN